VTTFIKTLRTNSRARTIFSRTTITGVIAIAAIFGAATTSATASTKTAAAELPKIKHIWYIIMENKSYDATFSGLNNNTYLWKTLPSQGTLLTNYYGTGHYSQDNYTALVSGQSPLYDQQLDSPTYKDATGSVITDKSDPNYGQFKAAGDPYTLQGSVYPSSVQTIFNQLTSANVSWKAYAQDLGYADASGAPHSVTACGAPGSDPTNTPVANPGGANATDQYVAKHFPLPWFHSIIDNASTMCDSKHSASLFDAQNGLYADLKSEATTPAFSWISPNNCSDAHDAVCYGNNLSGGWIDPNTPAAPLNYTGGLYAGDLFLEHIIPEIQASPAYKDNGLIIVSFDEGFPAYTFTGNSFQNASAPATVAASLAADSAGQNINGVNVNTEPTGPNAIVKTDAAGNQLYPGPGFNAFVDRDKTIPGIVMGGASPIPGARTDASASADGSSSYISDNSIQAYDTGRTVTGNNIPDGATVGTVYDLPSWASLPKSSTSTCPNSCVVTGSFQLLVNGQPVAPNGPVSGITLGARTAITDPMFDATHATLGGGDVGMVLISKFNKPGSTVSTFYNHYSFLRSLEDLFSVAKASPGLDGKGHLGFAAQPGLKAFGSDVFNNK
jgi:uncharacterized Zn-binding protein involved in type VI secretion